MKTVIGLKTVSLAVAVIGLSCGTKQAVAPPPRQSTMSADSMALECADLLSQYLGTRMVTRRGEVAVAMSHDTTATPPIAAAYRAYNAVVVAAAEYNVDGHLTSVELARFRSVEDAYGCYAGFRPTGAGGAGFGIESFTMGKDLCFTRGGYLVRVSVADLDSAGVAARTLVARAIHDRIKDPPSVARYFLLFPHESRITFSNQYHVDRFLNIAGLSEIYTAAYLVNGDTVRLFVGTDQSGEKFLKLREYADSLETSTPVPQWLTFAEHAVVFRDVDRRRIVAGLVHGKLVGIIGYDSTKNDLLCSRWVGSLR
ncbi:MAG TPA: DUF6599 family protein [Candidatus Deferrimicrobium sp.]|nr:DUF6599 family protein [Candidatus Deferrimicrobium sp.]